MTTPSTLITSPQSLQILQCLGEGGQHSTKDLKRLAGNLPAVIQSLRKSGWIIHTVGTQPNQAYTLDETMFEHLPGVDFTQIPQTPVVEVMDSAEDKVVFTHQQFQLDIFKSTEDAQERTQMEQEVWNLILTAKDAAAKAAITLLQLNRDSRHIEVTKCLTDALAYIDKGLNKLIEEPKEKRR